MTGKEALDDYKDFGKIKGESTTSNQTFVPSPYHNEWRQKYFEEIEDVNLRADMVCATNDELENKLSKYERAFEILKGLLSLDKDTSLDGKVDFYTLYFTGELPYECYKRLTKEEYELLEELMNT